MKNKVLSSQINQLYPSPKKSHLFYCHNLLKTYPSGGEDMGEAEIEEAGEEASLRCNSICNL